MTILQAGVEKSGNYWLHSILQDLLSAKGIESKSFIQNHPIFDEAKDWKLSTHNQEEIDVIDVEADNAYFRISSRFREQIENLDDYLSRSNHVWTHSPFVKEQMDLYQKFDKIVYLIRDPRDVLISLSKFMFTPYMQEYYPTKMNTPAQFLETRLGTHPQFWSRHTLGYLEARELLDIHIVFYENLLQNFKEEVVELSKYLGVDLSSEQIDQIKRDNSFRKMKEENPDHVRKAKLYNWREKMNFRQVQAIVKTIGPTLSLFNYSLSKDDEVTLPDLPAMDEIHEFKDKMGVFIIFRRFAEWVKSSFKKVYYYLLG